MSWQPVGLLLVVVEDVRGRDERAVQLREARVLVQRHRGLVQWAMDLADAKAAIVALADAATLLREGPRRVRALGVG